MFFDFEEIKQRCDILQVAQDLGLELKKSGAGYRCPCLACNGENARGLVITPGKGFYCFATLKGGDVIGLVSHTMSIGPKEAAGWLTEMYGLGTVSENSTSTVNRKERANAPQNEKSGNQPAPRFDPVAFASKLTTPEGVSDADAHTFKVGVHRGNLYVPAVYPSGTIAGWWKLQDGKLIPPKEWLPDQTNVVQLRRPA